jgi:pSer/pThr/pTyr-binding forkhead associated (FHA) protein
MTALSRVLVFCFRCWFPNLFSQPLFLPQQQPIGDCADIQAPIDLKSQAVFRVGRSPQSDVQLFHATSSRRHAMLFHHSNGSCYIIDCGSAHGTYVNGTRVESPPNNGVVVPHKVRRGSLIRFGGPGAPEFMLKSFNFELGDIMNDGVSSHDVPVCIMPVSTPIMTAVVEHNTRLNALGRTAKQSLLLQQQLLSSKRSFDSMETMPLLDEDMAERCSSPPLSPEQSPMRLVSPDSDCQQPSKRRRVTFSQDPPEACYPTLVSPDVSSDEHEDGSMHD